MKFSDLQKYKHDTIGKFQSIKELIESLDESNLKSEDSIEILMAADEAYELMNLASKALLQKLKS
jgi:hypothetical protein